MEANDCQKCYKKPARWISKRLDQTWRAEKRLCEGCAMRVFGKYDCELTKIQKEKRK